MAGQASYFPRFIVAMGAADDNLTSRNPPAGVVDYAFAAGAVTALVLGARSAFL